VAGLRAGRAGRIRTCRTPRLGMRILLHAIDVGHEAGEHLDRLLLGYSVIIARPLSEMFQRDDRRQWPGHRSGLRSRRLGPLLVGRLRGDQLQHRGAAPCRIRDGMRCWGSWREWRCRRCCRWQRNSFARLKGRFSTHKSRWLRSMRTTGHAPQLPFLTTAGTGLVGWWAGPSRSMSPLRR
jgi:hypothetical protein